jgi:ketosteroid isomerase-like protein
MTPQSLLKALLPLAALAPACSSDSVAKWPEPPAHFLQQVPVAPAQSPVTPTAQERGLAETYLKALAAPDFGALGSMLDEQAHFAFRGRTTHGRDRVLKGHAEMFGAFDQRQFIATRVWLTDSTHPLDSQAFEWTMTGVQAREFLGVPATHKQVFVKGLTLLWTNDNGVVSDLHVYFDEELVKAQLGVGPAELQKLPAPALDTTPARIFERAGTPEEPANSKLMRSMVQALEDDKEAEFLSLMADDVQICTMDHAEPTIGKKAASDYFRTMRRSIRLLDTVIENAWGVQSFAVAEYAITGLQFAPFPRVAFAEGRPLHTQFADIAEIHDGRIVRIWRYDDPIGFAAHDGANDHDSKGARK